MSIKVLFEPIREKGFAAITPAFTTIGTPTTHPVRIVKIQNNTDGDMYLTLDSTEDQIFVANGSFSLYDFTTNKLSKIDIQFGLPVGSQFYIRSKTVPTLGDVYIECVV